MSKNNCENNNNTEELTMPTNSIIYKFEHGERLKAEREAKERQRALFAKKMAKFGDGVDDQPQSTGKVNQKAKMFVDIANKDPEKERAERERKLEFEKKKLGFQEGSVPCNENKETGGSEVLKKKMYFTGESDALDEEAQRKIQEEEELKEQRKREFLEKSNFFSHSKE